MNLARLIGAGLLAITMATSAMASVLQTFADVPVLGTAATLIDAANGARVSLSCTNTSATIHIRVGDSNVTATRGEQLRAGLSFTTDVTGPVYGFSEGATVTLSCTRTVR